LSAIDLDGLKDEGTVGEFFKGAVLPLHYAFWTSGFLGCSCVSRCLDLCRCDIRTVCDGAVVG
jgi:hypothetical protein